MNPLVPRNLDEDFIKRNTANGDPNFAEIKPNGLAPRSHLDQFVESGHHDARSQKNLDTNGREPSTKHGHDSLEAIGPFRVKDLIYRSAIGSVYECHPVYPGGRRLAVKVLDAPFERTSTHKRFEREFEALKRLDHKAVASVIDAGWVGESQHSRPYIAMEFIEGKRLDEYDAEKDQTLDERLSLIRMIAEGLQHVHLKRVIHRDIKPSNILVTDTGHPVIIDFGISLLEYELNESAPSHTITGQVVGTPVYMSPEQMRGESLDTRSDLYSLGILAYEIISGCHPYDLDRVPVTQMSEVVCNQQPVPLGERVREARGSVAAVIGKAISVNRDHRYASASEFGAELERIQLGLPVTVASRSILETPLRLMRRHPTRTKIILLSSLVTIVLAGISGRYTLRLQEAAEHAAVLEEASEQSAKLVRLLLAQGFVDGVAKNIEYHTALLDGLSNSLDDQDLNPIARAQARVAIAESYIQSDEHEKALALFPLILSEHESLYGPMDERTLLQMARYAKKLQVCGEPDKADLMLAETIRRTPNSLDTTDPDLAGRLHYAHGEIRLQQGKLEEALAALYRAEPLLAKTIDSPEAQLLQLYAIYRIARILRAQGEFELAEDKLRELIELGTERLGPDHRDVAVAHQELAEVLEIQTP